MKTKKPSKKKSPSKTRETTRLDALWSAAVKVKAGRQCEVCGSTGILQSHHFFGRRLYVVRWDLDNGFCLCPHCHRLGEYSAHQSPEFFREWAVKTRGQWWLDELTARARVITKAAEARAKAALTLKGDD